MRYRWIILVGIAAVLLSSRTYTNGQPKLQFTAPAKIVVLNGPPDLAVNVTVTQQILYGSTRDSVSDLATLSISVENRLTPRSGQPLMLVGSDVSPVTLRITLPSEGTLFQVGNIGVDSGFTCGTMNNNVLCIGGTIPAGKQAHISVDVAGTQERCSVQAPVTVEVDPSQNEVTKINNTITIYLYVVNVC
jgi:hypothetical protein